MQKFNPFVETRRWFYLYFLSEFRNDLSMRPFLRRRDFYQLRYIWHFNFSYFIQSETEKARDKAKTIR